MSYVQTPQGRDGREGDDSVTEDVRIREQVSALKRWFNQHPDMRCLLLVDPSQRDPLADDAGDNPLSADLPKTDVVIDHEAVSPTHYPYLLELDLKTESDVAALAESARLAFEDRRPQSMAEGLGQRIGGWLASSASAREVAAHCSRLALQNDDRGRLCLVRFYDPRSQALLWPLLAPAQQHALLGPIQAWHTLDAGAATITRMNTVGRRDDFVLDDAQWQAIQCHGIVNRALALHAYDLDRQPKQHEVDAAVAASLRARRYGLTDEEDEVAFVGHALSLHPEFDLHPRVLQILGSRADGDLYTERIDELTSDEIAEIRQGIWHERLRNSASPAGRG
ncbi:TPA: DUF4123 domain-containing protein [Burkholderia aenigmatica]|uniref:DUF4123 domain-containing protein n=1 Tax=Burkholderia sp. AU45251 TaxID=3059204 RepID=UPI00265545D2|nr:DUF4123 domain-containing protein [Burkholderia sp. AU45251]HDR9483959.1 DUF4123 domain-containing protein [Burkholderia aenigmatica]MDN7516218.1 DUF4123 domain-containing protein [Burkholderia sp. AU45251]HDR9514924.1 DUF4123 domain-containing protein [Burkholderia aenigmatica]HDR9592009.1 DUF4123 domain-containing protein [Burkholderia aenigmatica]HDR9601215.1 DUF4123 domain-containing protein [Burkholderia aenigmatica]